MKVQSFTFNPFQTNCYICHSDGEAVIIDAAGSTPEEHAEMEAYIEEHGLAVRHLLLTHAHIDHILGCRYLAERYGLDWQVHPSEAPLLQGAQEQGRLFGISVVQPPAPGRLLQEGDTVEFGAVTLRVLHAPGHSPGSICFYSAEEKAVISGDVLFAGSIGRTDLWQGSLPELMASIHQKLLPLGEDVRVYPGHGPDTTIGQEQRSNPFLTEGFAPMG